MLVKSGLLFAISASACVAALNLPVYIEDSHAGTFYWAIRNLPLDADAQLVLIDAHSDASEVFNSDAVRQQVLHAASAGELDDLIQKWRSRGVIQSFDWIEPLIPHPISKVWWVPAAPQHSPDAVQQINAHQMTAPRQGGDFSRRYVITDLNSVMKQVRGPVVVSIDLDYFSQGTAKVDHLLQSILTLPGLQAMTIAISRPYLASEAQAHQLLYEALAYLTRIINIDIHFEPFASTGEDRSRKAQDFYRKHMDVPHYDIASAPAVLRSLLLRNVTRIEVGEDREKWNRLLDTWRNEGAVPRIALIGGGDENLVPVGRPFQIRIENYKAQQCSHIRWKILVPAHEKYNLTNEEEGFAAGAPRFLLFDERPLPAADGLAALDEATLLPSFDPRTGWGTIRVFCELTVGTQTYTSNVVPLSRYQGDGYLGKLTEIFNLPYIYGSAMLHENGKTSADARYGADCSHFIIYGLRRQGLNLPYVNPKELLHYLDDVDEFSAFHDGIALGRTGPIHLTDRLLLHFGNHVAAVFEDTGVLKEQTRVVHQLESYPEITTFGAMARKYRRIRIMRVQ
ncbi:MAG TPA: hypothetical protein VKU01_30970 [Bryobacteraceae bacterium]|nr:hypothetical protein [Bryobacteraceae bacterium]